MSFWLLLQIYPSDYPTGFVVQGHMFVKWHSFLNIWKCTVNISQSIEFKIICLALFTIQSLQSSFTGN